MVELLDLLLCDDENLSWEKKMCPDNFHKNAILFLTFLHIIMANFLHMMTKFLTFPCQTCDKLYYISTWSFFVVEKGIGKSWKLL